MECERDRLQVPQSQGYAVFEVWHLRLPSGEVAVPKRSLSLTQVASEQLGRWAPFPNSFTKSRFYSRCYEIGESTDASLYIYIFGFLFFRALTCAMGLG